jgi:hypothetical protein
VKVIQYLKGLKGEKENLQKKKKSSPRPPADRIPSIDDIVKIQLDVIYFFVSMFILYTIHQKFDVFD